MQTRPDASELLNAVARFLLEEVGPKLAGDKALEFRLLIAANLVSMVGNEVRTSLQREASARDRLKVLLGHDGTFEELSHELVLALRAKTIEPSAALDHLQLTAQETLEVINPSFELS